MGRFLSPNGPGFTLAEVLITLGIIGIISAMTIPALISEYRQKALDNNFKLAYSYINNAHRGAQVSLGYFPRCYYGMQGGKAIFDGCKEYSELFLSQFKIIKTCENNALSNGCVPKYKSWEEVKKENEPDLSDEDIEVEMSGCGNLGKVLFSRYPAYYLANGMIIMPGAGAERLASNLIIDINGVQGPNKWGYDLFYVYLYYDTKKIFVVNDAGGCMPVEKGGNMFSYKAKELFGQN